MRAWVAMTVTNPGTNFFFMKAPNFSITPFSPLVVEWYTRTMFLLDYYTVEAIVSVSYIWAGPYYLTKHIVSYDKSFPVRTVQMIEHCQAFHHSIELVLIFCRYKWLSTVKLFITPLNLFRFSDSDREARAWCSCDSEATLVLEETTVSSVLRMVSRINQQYQS